MTKIYRVLILSLGLGTAVINTGCGDSFGVQEPASVSVTPTPTPVVESSSVKLIAETTVTGATMQKIRIKEDHYRAVYVAFFKPITNANRPTVIVVRPDDGFGWSEETIDQTWFSRAAGSYPDSNAYSWGGTSTVDFTKVTDTDLRTAASFYLNANMNVAFVFTRHYAGGTIVDYFGDVAVALRYVNTRENVDATNIGVVGDSWGAFYALFGSALTSVNIKSMVLDTPVLDLANMAAYLRFDLGYQAPATYLLSQAKYDEYVAYMAPYYLRIYPESGGPIGDIGVDFTRWTQARASAALARLSGRALVIADSSDTLTPIADTMTVVDDDLEGNVVGAKAIGLYCTGPATNYGADPEPSHVSDPTILKPSVRETLRQLEVVSRLGSSATTYTINMDGSDMNDFMFYMESREATDGGISEGVLNFVRQASRANIVWNDADGSYTSGPAFVRHILEDFWGHSAIPAASTAADDELRTYIDDAGFAL